MAAAALLSITTGAGPDGIFDPRSDPAGSEKLRQPPSSFGSIARYLRWALKWRWLVLVAAAVVLALTIVPYERIGIGVHTAR